MIALSLSFSLSLIDTHREGGRGKESGRNEERTRKMTKEERKKRWAEKRIRMSLNYEHYLCA